MKKDQERLTTWPGTIPICRGGWDCLLLWSARAAAAALGESLDEPLEGMVVI